MTERHVLACALAAALAGCLASDDLQLTQLSETIPQFAGDYTFQPPVVHDGAANLVPPDDLLDPAVLPVAVESLVPGMGAEPNLGVTSKGTILVTSFDQVMRSTDRGRTWHLAVDYVPPGYPVTQDMLDTFDPMFWRDPDTDRVFANHMTSTCTYLQWSDDDGAPGTWHDRPMACLIPGIDHQKLMTASPGPRAPPIPLVAYPNVLYICMNKGLDLAATSYGTSCAISYDGGVTFPYETSVYVNDQLCGNINGHPAAWPDGTVAMALGNFGRRCDRPITVAVSEDNGFSWALRQCDSTRDNREIDADITVTPDGTAYLLYRDADELVHLLRSRDKFATCDHFRVAPPDHTMNAFTVITSGDDGRIAMAYLGTREPQKPGTEPSNVTGGTVWHAFVTTSLDAGSDNPTFLTQQVTPQEDPMQVGCIWLHGGGGGPYQCRNLLDFGDMVRDDEGRYYFTFADGCTPRNGCSGTVEQADFQSRDRQVAVFIQDRGESLFAAQGLLPPIGLEWATPIER